MDQTEKIIGIHLEQTLRALRQRYQAVLKDAGLDITPEQWVLLDLLERHGSLSQAELAHESLKDAPTVSRMIGHLIRKKLVQRKRGQDDQRRYEVALTEGGKRACKLTRPGIQNLRARGWQGMSDQAYEDFLRVLHNIQENMAE